MAKKNSNGSSRSKGLNKHQRSAFKEGEERVGREEIQELLQMSQSEDPTDRLQAASFLCPCHVRKRIDGVWEALYRMLEDDDLKVSKRRKEIEFEVTVISDFADRGKCDFCGEASVPIKKDFETELDVGSSRRFAMVCEPCDKAA